MKKYLLENKDYTNQYDEPLYLGIYKNEDDDFIFLISKSELEKSWNDIQIEFTKKEIKELKNKGLFKEENFEIIDVK
jgi:hypothetical protein